MAMAVSNTESTRTSSSLTNDLFSALTFGTDNFRIPSFQKPADLDLNFFLSPSVFKPETNSPEATSKSILEFEDESESGRTTPRNQLQEEETEPESEEPISTNEHQQPETEAEPESEEPVSINQQQQPQLESEPEPEEPMLPNEHQQPEPEPEEEKEQESEKPITNDTNEEMGPLNRRSRLIGKGNTDTMKEVSVQVPSHPIPSMQAAFAESMREANEGTRPPPPQNRGTAAARRKILLEQEDGAETHASKWRQRPGGQYHELWKLAAQISFGVYLLMKGIAKDDDQVIKILQGHVDEVDEFLETTLEDFDLAQEDIDERLKYLKLPLENISIFDAMLTDRDFRLQIVSGNERIEHVITRTAKAMNDALKDVQHGLTACKEFTIYLAEEEKNQSVWMKERLDMLKVFDAMKGNVEGWYKAYVSLQTKGNHLGVALVQLGTIVAEMDRRAGEVGRKSVKVSMGPSRQMVSPPVSPPRSKELRQSMSRSLPSDPNLITPAIAATLPAFQLVQDRELTPEDVSETGDEEGEMEEEEEEEPEPVFLLSPTTYSPVPSPTLPPSTYTPAPSPKIPYAPAQPEAPPPEVSKRSSLRQRFSLKRTSLKRQETPAENAITPKAAPPADRESTRPQPRIVSIARSAETVQPDRGRENTHGERTRESTVRERPREKLSPFPPPPRTGTFGQQPQEGRSRSRPRELPSERARGSTFGEQRERHRPREISILPPSRHNPEHKPTPLNTPPSRGLDSAYCSDFEKTTSPSAATIVPPYQQRPRTSSSQANNGTTRPFHAPPLPSPRSDQQQFFRPVQASPHSPLQRPWTAGPSNPLHMHSNSSTSNISQLSQRTYQGHHAHTPSQLGNRRGAPSAMGMSMRSDMTTMTELTVGGTEKKVKKERSAFGWLKKAFTLDEDEKRTYEERRERGHGERDDYYQRRAEARKWVDGKRVR